MYEVKARLGEILKERNMTQIVLANKANVPQSAISRFDRNEQHKDVHLVSISKALNLQIEDLFHITKKEDAE
ncbi:helix-turn-helix domain-containing protein [Bacillus massiliglaciei]|uniref:helix-turn-helix domain-containing protein n=1 Tax=Bacillus massiliglaciei TaxID=1816693 RepID=UPI000DA60F9C|nr:helix-turn-helix transcriptional regulator [Bacillus massiliglaciei]